MLALSHLTAGAAVGLAVERRWPRTLTALGTHLVLDGIGHDDESIGPAGQAVLAGAGLSALALCCGPTSSAVLGALAGAVPDSEIAANLVLLGGRVAQYLFPSHWQIGELERPQHPYRFPGPGIPIAVELAVTTGALAALCAAGWRRRRAAG